MKRYNDEQITVNKRGIPVRRLPIYNPPIERDSDTVILTEMGDRLDTLSTQFYGTPMYWWVIALANNLHNAYLSLPEGMTLVIPTEPTAFIR